MPEQAPFVERLEKTEVEARRTNPPTGKRKPGCVFRLRVRRRRRRLDVRIGLGLTCRNAARGRERRLHAAIKNDFSFHPADFALRNDCSIHDGPVVIGSECQSQRPSRRQPVQVTLPHHPIDCNSPALPVLRGLRASLFVIPSTFDLSTFDLPTGGRTTIRLVHLALRQIRFSGLSGFHGSTNPAGLSANPPNDQPDASTSLSRLCTKGRRGR